MELDQSDLKYFVPFVLLDEAGRDPSGKRQPQPMKGFWIGGQIRRGMRLSDGALRRAVCIEALQAVGCESITSASAYVAAVLGKSTEGDVSVIRAGYYDCAVQPNERNFFFGQFLSWRQWVLESTQRTLQFFLEEYGRRFPEHWQTQLAKLFDAVREDPAQTQRHREWRLWVGSHIEERLMTKRWDPESQWVNLATDYSTLAEVRKTFGDANEARQLFEQALEIWKARGEEVPHRQALAIPLLERQILAATALSQA